MPGILSIRARKDKWNGRFSLEAVARGSDAKEKFRSGTSEGV
jgi:hypothetical protein